MCGECDELLRQAREELYHARVVVASLRNRTKTDTALLSGSEERIGGLISQIEARLNGSPRPKEAQGHDQHEALSQAH